jgi:hypothetical protein
MEQIQAILKGVMGLGILVVVRILLYACVAGKRFRHAALDFLVVGLAALGLVLTGHGNALADTNTDQYLTDMAAAGFSNRGGNQDEIGVGLQICAWLANGTSQDDAAHRLWVDSQLPSQDSAQMMVSIAVKDLCPEQGDST